MFCGIWFLQYEFGIRLINRIVIQIVLQLEITHNHLYEFIIFYSFL